MSRVITIARDQARQYPGSKLLPESDFLYVLTSGRKTGKRRTAKIRYVQLAGNTLCVLAQSGMRPDWMRNFASDRRGESIVASRGLYGKIDDARFLTRDGPEEKNKLLRLFNAKYADAEAANQYSDSASSVIILISFSPLLGHKPSLGELEFDFQARSYQNTILANPISRWMREVTIDWLSSLFNPGQSALEIGCGTGIETIPLAKQGIRIIATDVSSGMLSELTEAANKQNLSNLIQTRHLSSSALSLLKTDPAFPPGGLDGAFSNFGAVNLEPDLGQFASSLRALLKKDAPVSFAVWNRFCLAQCVAKLVTGKGLPIDRLEGRVRASDHSRYSLDTFAYSPGEFASFFRRNFEVESIFALPTLIPPSEYSRGAGVLLKFKRVDLAIGKIPLLNRIGENFVITLRAI